MVAILCISKCLNPNLLSGLHHIASFIESQELFSHCIHFLIVKKVASEDNADHVIWFGVPTGIRTTVTGVKGLPHYPT